MRVCKNCLRYFAVTGKASTEYCDRICDSKGRTCREIGAINTWTQRKQGDEVFKGISQRVQKAFRPHQRRQADQERVLRLERGSQKEKKEDCDNGTIAPEDFSRWLKDVHYTIGKSARKFHSNLCAAGFF